MKTISGRVTDTKAISVAKAAKILSTFVSAETGASKAVSAYLRCASYSFDEVALLHKNMAKKNKHEHDDADGEIVCSEKQRSKKKRKSSNA